MSCVDQEQTDEDLVEEIRRVRSAGNNTDMSCVLRKPDFCIYAKSKMQISCAADLRLCFHICKKTGFLKMLLICCGYAFTCLVENCQKLVFITCYLI